MLHAKISIHAYGYVITNLFGRFKLKWLHLCQLNCTLNASLLYQLQYYHSLATLFIVNIFNFRSYLFENSFGEEQKTTVP